MTFPILVVNAGSSSVKFSVHDADDDRPLRFVVGGQIAGIGSAPHFHARTAASPECPDGAIITDIRWEPGPGHRGALSALAMWLEAHFDGVPIGAIGHRVVHGGSDFRAPVRIDDGVLEALEALVPLAPLHQPHNIAGIRGIVEHEPGLPQVACFDTAFHRGHAFEVEAFALPLSFYRQGVRRYGFHGLSYEYLSGVLPGIDPDLAGPDVRVICAHLGSGCSLCGMIGGRSVDSSMGFTALDGLPMGTRCGTLDPGVVLYMMDTLGIDPAEIARILYTESGLKGLSGIGNDMRALEASDTPDASRAIRLFVHRVAREIGALAAGLGGVDGIVFTAGIGENSAGIRAAVMERCRWLGLIPDAAANDAARRRDGAARLTARDSAVGAWMVPTDEELMVATHTSRLVRGDRGGIDTGLVAAGGAVDAA